MCKAAGTCLVSSKTHCSNTPPALIHAWIKPQWLTSTETEPRSHKKKYTSNTSSEPSMFLLWSCANCVTPASGKMWKSLLHYTSFSLPPGSQHFGKWKSEMVSLCFCQCMGCSNWRKCAMREVTCYRDTEFSKKSFSRKLGDILSLRPWKMKFLWLCPKLPSLPGLCSDSQKTVGELSEGGQRSKDVIV